MTRVLKLLLPPAALVSLAGLFNLLVLHVAVRPVLYTAGPSPYRYGPEFLSADSFSDRLYVFDRPVPYGLAVAASAAVPGLWCGLTVFGYRRLRHRRRRGLCERCGYDLTGNVSGTCPECGTAAAGVAAGNVRPLG